VLHVEVEALGEHLHGPCEVSLEELPQTRGGVRLPTVLEHLLPGGHEHGGEVHLHAVVQRILPPRQRGPVAARVRSLPGKLQRVAIAGEACREVLHAQELGDSRPVLQHHLHAATKQLRIAPRANRDRDVRRDAQPVGRLQHEE